MLFLKPLPEDLLPIDVAMATELQQLLTRSGDYSGPVNGIFEGATFQALERYGARANLEERLLHDSNDQRLDRKVIEYMRAQIKQSD